jgi:Lar family restriction alleviation protein
MTDPRAVADDPSGIVQQMPEGGDEVLAPCPFCGEQARVIAGQAGFYPPTAYCEQCEVSMKAPECLTDKLIAAWNRRATEGDLRAEVERLRALAGTAIDQWESFVESDYAGTGRYDAMIADVKAARADLSPETDGGQDG